MTKDQWLALASEAYDLGQVQQKTFRDTRYDNGKRDPHSLFGNVLFWKYQGVIQHQFFKLVDALVKSTTDEDRAKRRLMFLSVVASFLDRFISLEGENSTTVSSRSNLKERGVQRG